MAKALLYLLVGAALVASPAWGADGDFVGTSTNKGDFSTVRVLICDGATGGATKTCMAALTPAMFDTNQAGVGLVVQARVSIVARAGCAGNPVIILQGRDAATGSGVYDVTTLTVGGTESVLFTPAHRYYLADVTVGTGCTDLELVVEFMDRKPD